MATLVVMQGPDKGRTFYTGDEPVVLGRESEQVPLTDRTVSRHHAEMQPEDGGWVLRDLRSANGTYVAPPQSRKQQQKQLHHWCWRRDSGQRICPKILFSALLKLQTSQRRCPQVEMQMVMVMH